MGLNEYYNNVRSKLLMRLPLPSLNEAYFVLIREDSERGLSIYHLEALQQASHPRTQEILPPFI